MADTVARLSLAAAARSSGLDRATVRRRLLAHGVKLDSYRSEAGAVELPVPLLLEAGVPVGRPSPPDAQPAPDIAEELARERARRLEAEAKLAGVEATLAATRETVDALNLALRMLGPGVPQEAPRRRRWLSR